MKKFGSVTTQSMQRNSLQSLASIVFTAVFVLVLASGTQLLSIDSDLGRHLTLGNYMLNNRIIPTSDLLSHTLAGQSRPPYEWLSQVIFAICNRLLGLDGVILLTAIIIAASLTIIFQQAMRSSRSVVISLLIVFLAASATSIHWLPRPHIMSFLFLAIWVRKLEQLRKHDIDNITYFPAITLLWANLHGGFVFGFLALAAYIAGWIWEIICKKYDPALGRRLAMATSLSLAASIITPGLWHNWEAVLNNRSSFILSRTVETMPADLLDTTFAPFTILLALSILFAFLNRHNLAASHIFLLGGLGIASIAMARNIPLFAIACAPILSDWLSSSLARFKRWQEFDGRFVRLSKPGKFPMLSIFVVALSIGYMGIRHTTNKPLFSFNTEVFPVAAANWLEENPIQGRMFNDFNWGGYLLYRFWPSQLVFVDSQSDFYGESLMRDYESIYLANKGWQALLDHYDISWIIIPIRSPLAKTLSSNLNWSIAYQDPIAIIIFRRE